MTSPLVPELLHSSPLSADTKWLSNMYQELLIYDLQDSVVCDITVQDVLDGSIKMPFTSRIAWLSTQQECQDLRRTHAYLSQGTRPTKKLTNIPDVKRYLRVTTISTPITTNYLTLLLCPRLRPCCTSNSCLVSSLHIIKVRPKSYSSTVLLFTAHQTGQFVCM